MGLTVIYHFIHTQDDYNFKNVSEDIEKLECSYVAFGNVKCEATLKTSLAVPQNIIDRITRGLNISTPRYIFKRNEYICAHKNLCKNVHDSITHNSQKQKQTKFTSIHEWINKMWCIQIMEYYSAIKRNEVPTHATTQVNFENVMPNGRSQLQNATYCMIPLM